MSIVSLTVLAGMGEGLFVFLVLGDAKALMTGSPLAPSVLLAGAAVSLILAGTGTLASFFHLHHKARGVKAVLQWKNSWLSREALLLPVFMGFVALYAGAVIIDAGNPLRLMAGALGIMSAFALSISSGMIYTVIRFIREWNTVYTPVNFTMIGLASGAMATVAVFEMAGASSASTLTLLRGASITIFLAMIFKLLTYKRNSRLYSPSNTQTAIGLIHPDIRIMDMGSSYAHYNTKEYYHTAYRNKHKLLRAIVIIGLFVIPMFMIMQDYRPLLSGGSGVLAPFGALLMLVCSFVERWLFFAEGNHVQNLYYGTFEGGGIANPLLTPNKDNAPLPPR